MIAIIKGCGNNIASLQYALQRIGVDAVVTDDIDVIRRASRVILPGVGQAEKAMHMLRKQLLIEVICQLTQPVIGICVGMQLLFEYSEEGNTQGLGIIPGVVKRMLSSETLPIPHIGWNQVLTSEEELGDMYFVHSYVVPVNDHTTATCDYNGKFSAIVQYKNFMGMQFHPEKSGKLGEILLTEVLR